MERSEVRPAKDIAAVRVATLLCDSKILKREILCTDESNYDNEKHEHMSHPDKKRLWKSIIVRITIEILNEQRLPEKLIEEITGLVLLVARRILTWASYHEAQIGFSRAYSMRFLNSSFFLEGIIDNKRAAQSLINNRNLNAKQRFKLACLYCFTDDIRTAFNEMTEEDMEEFYNSERPESIKQPHLVKFWTNYLKNEVNETGEILDRYRIRKAAKSGSKTGVEYFLTLSNFNTDLLLDAALAAVKSKLRARNDLIVFRNDSDISGLKLWVPNDYFVDILNFVLLQMNMDEKVEFLKRDTSGDEYRNLQVRIDSKSRVLEYFLNWPFQCEFMKTADLMWDFLPVESFCDLLLLICNKITNTKYEDKVFDYRNLFQEFWHRSSERFKRFALSNKEIKSVIYYEVKPLSRIIENLLTFENFTVEDGKMLGTILSSGTDEEIENILCCREWTALTLKLIKSEKWDILDWIFPHCFPHNMQPSNLKKQVISSQFWLIFVHLFENNMNLVDSFIRWSRLSVEEITLLHKSMLDSESFQSHCVNLLTDQLSIADMMLKWCISSEEELIAYKRQLLSSPNALGRFSNLVLRGKSKSVDKVLNWCFTREEDIQVFKKKVAYATEMKVFVFLISNHWDGNVQDRRLSSEASNYKFFEGKWEVIDAFLSWCFSSENDIRDFKKRILDTSGEEIHFILVKCNKWQEAEFYFSWLELSSEQIRELKRRTLFNYEPTFTMFCNFLYSRDDNQFLFYGGKNDAIELFLRWFLTDEQMLRDFKDKFYQTDHIAVSSERKESALRYFDSMLEQRLEDIHKENTSLQNS